MSDEQAGRLSMTVIMRADFLDACARRDLGRVLQIAIKWGGPVFTASHIARQCALGVSRVGEYISGKRKAHSLEVWMRVADGLRIPGHLLELGQRPWENEEDSVDRREFINLGAATGAAALSSSLGLTSPTSGNRIGSSARSDIAREIVRLRRLDDTVSGSDLYQLYKPVADRLERMLDEQSYSDLTKHELLTLYSEHQQQTGWAAFDAGNYKDAFDCYRDSFDAAQKCGDRELAANAMAFQAYQLVTTGRDGTDMTAKSVALSGGQARAGVRALLCQRGAWSYAVAGDVDRSAELLAAAQDAIEADRGDSPDWAAWASSELEQNIMVGRCWAQLGRPLRAIPPLEAAMAEYGDHHARDKALYLSSLADAYIDAGELEQAAAVAAQAMDRADLVSSPRPHARLARVHERLKPYSATPEVAHVLARGSSYPS